MDKKTKIGIIIFIVVLIIGIGLIFCLCKNLNKDGANNLPEDYIYVIEYFDGHVPGSNYTLYIHENYDITVIDQPGCSTVECMEGTYYPSSSLEKVSFSDANKEIIKEFIDVLFKGKISNKIDISDEIWEMDENEQTILSAIQHNDEKYLDYLK